MIGALIVVGYLVVGFVSAVIATRVSKSVCEEQLGHFFLLIWPVAIAIAILVKLCDWIDVLGGCSRVVSDAKRQEE